MTAKPRDPGDPLLAYRDEAFLDTDDARPLRILSEYLAPMHAFAEQQVQDTIVFFGSARILPTGPFGRYYAEARELARLLTEWSLAVDGPTHRHIILMRSLHRIGLGVAIGTFAGSPDAAMATADFAA